MNLRLEKAGDAPCFVVDGGQICETMFIAAKLSPARAAETSRRVLYKGPFLQETMEGGRNFRRGKFVAVNETLYAFLPRVARDQFVFADAR